MIDQNKRSALSFVLSDEYVYSNVENKNLEGQTHDDEVNLEPTIHARYNPRIEPRDDIEDFF